MIDTRGPHLVCWPKGQERPLVTALPPSFEGKVLTVARLVPLLPEARWRVMVGDLRSRFEWDAA